MGDLHVYIDIYIYTYICSRVAHLVSGVVEVERDDLCRVAVERAELDALEHRPELGSGVHRTLKEQSGTSQLKGALQLLINRYGCIRFAEVPERVSTKSVIVLIIENSKSNH